ncbi:MAG: tetratricopeptide repeat protein [Kiritimatiellaeota bacterium]|nr:tetratricopeptide repeat protein [Kiritimatiellota bacterium]
MRIPGLVPAFFFLSGLAGLVHELVWARLLAAAGVSSVFAVSGTVAVFMGGLALGSLWVGPWVDRVRDGRRLLAAYGVLELTVAVLGAAAPGFPALLRPWSRFLYRRLGEYFIGYDLAAFFPAAILLLVPVVCMGATLPVLSRFYAVRRADIGTRLGRLYGLNTIGAAFGALLCGFVLINRLGVSGAAFFAASINAGIGLVCLGASRRLPVLSAPGSGRGWEGGVGAATAFPVDASGRVAVLAVFAVSGACGMAVEVVWARLLAVLIGPTPYSFTIVSTCFILGLGVGSVVFGRLADRGQRPVEWLLVTQIAAAVFVLGVSQVLGNSQFVLAKLIDRLHGNFGALAAVETGVLFLLMLAPTACFGAAFPLVMKIVTPSGLRLGRSVGTAYALNAAGSVAGALTAGFVLMPWVGKANSLRLVSALQLFGAGLAALWFFSRGRRRHRRGLAFAGAAFAALGLCAVLVRWDPNLLAVGRYQRFGALGPILAQTGWTEALVRGPAILRRYQRNTELLFAGEDVTGSVAVARTIDPLGGTELVLLCSGKPDASTRGDLGTQVLCAHFPLVFHPRPRRVMVLGLGSGITAGEVLHYPVERLDVVEVSPRVVEAGRLFSAWNNGVLSDPRSRVLVQDGRVHLEMTDRKYDVIISEPSNPWMAGMAGLFTREFFQAVRARLNPGGVFAQWIHSYQMDWKTFALAGRTFATVFPRAVLAAASPRGEDYLLLGFADGGGLDAATARKNIALARRSGNVDLPSPYIFYRIISNESLRSLFGPGPIHTRDRPLLEFAAPLRMFTDSREIQTTLLRRRNVSSATESFLRDHSRVADQIDFARFALSVSQPFHGMVDLSRATPKERKRFTDMMAAYCRGRVLDDYSILADPELRARCLAVQIQALRARLAKAPDDLSTLEALARAHLAAGELPQAADVLRRALEKAPERATLHNDLGTVLLQAGRTEEAIAEYTRALRLSPELAQAHYNLGSAYLESERPGRAVEHYLKALDIDPDDPDAHRNLGVAYTRLGRLNSAIAEYRKALYIRPEDARTQYNLGNASLRNRDATGAMIAFRRAVALDPGFTEAWVNLGNACLAANRLDAAIAAYGKALEQTPNDPSLRTNLGNALLRKRKVEAALEQYRKALELDPERAQVHAGLCLAFLMQRKYDDARRHYRLARRLGAVLPSEIERLLDNGGRNSVRRSGPQ